MFFKLHPLILNFAGIIPRFVAQRTDVDLSSAFLRGLLCVHLMPKKVTFDAMFDRSGDFVTPSEQPDEIAADFLPDVENCFESTKGIAVKSLMNGVPDYLGGLHYLELETQRPSFYNFDVPTEGLSQAEALAPNRLLHEMRQDEMKFFMGRLQERPKWLSQKVSKKRQELLVKDNHASCLGRVWASFVERSSS
eukprot:symbB.v1.2.016901.t1/scaffold1302.1/size209015/9